MESLAFFRSGRIRRISSYGPKEVMRWRTAWQELTSGRNKWGHEPLPAALVDHLMRKGEAGRRQLVPDEAAAIAAAEAAGYEARLNRRPVKR
jgi:hypothetical protein